MRLGDIAQTAAKLFSSFERGSVDSGASSRMVDQLGQWMGHLTRNAAIHWGPNFVDPYVCVHCEMEAVSECLVCADPICLAHGMVRHNADMLCDECVGKLVAQKRGNPRRKKASETHHHHHHYHRQGPSTPGGPSPEALLQQALLLLGLQQGATWEQVQAAYKAAAVANHPDKYQGAQREQAEARLKNINAAYEVLKGHYKRAA